MKHRLTVHLSPALMSKLEEFANQKAQSKSMVAEAAIEFFLTSDDPNRHEGALLRRLDHLTRQIERLERDQTISVEALGLFIHYWLTLIPPLPESAQAAAKAKGRERFEFFIETLGRRLSGGKRLLNDILIDLVADAPEKTQVT